MGKGRRQDWEREKLGSALSLGEDAGCLHGKNIIRGPIVLSL